MGNVIRIVVADDSDLMREMIVDSLSDNEDIEVVGEASDGATAIQQIKETHPDIVLLDLVMPMVDGLGVMEAIAGDEEYGDNKPKYIVVSAAGSENIVNHALQTGASYYIMKPFDCEALVKRIKHMVGMGLSEANQIKIMGNDAYNENIEQHITSLIRSLGVPVRMVGYKYLRDAILIAVDDRESLMSVTKNVYPAIAMKHGTSPGNVERNIRYVIEATWNRSQENPQIKELFKNIVKKPTNSEFILVCSEWVHYQMKN